MSALGSRTRCTIVLVGAPAPGLVWTVSWTSTGRREPTAGGEPPILVGAIRPGIWATDIDDGFVAIHPPQCQNYRVDSGP